MEKDTGTHLTRWRAYFKWLYGAIIFKSVRFLFAGTIEWYVAKSLENRLEFRVTPDGVSEKRPVSYVRTKILENGRTNVYGGGEGIAKTPVLFFHCPWSAHVSVGNILPLLIPWYK